MIKAVVVFENTELVYKTKKKESLMDRYKPVNSTREPIFYNEY